tara:strand:- start:312 stop:434 length:123 start_codon:yes stop_codon:yes gene_type:complete
MIIIKKIEVFALCFYFKDIKNPQKPNWGLKTKQINLIYTA